MNYTGYSLNIRLKNGLKLRMPLVDEPCKSSNQDLYTNDRIKQLAIKCPNGVTGYVPLRAYDQVHPNNLVVNLGSYNYVFGGTITLYGYPAGISYYTGIPDYPYSYTEFIVSVTTYAPMVYNCYIES